MVIVIEVNTVSWATSLSEFPPLLNPSYEYTFIPNSSYTGYPSQKN